MANPVLEEGKRAPAFTLPSTDGKRVRLTDLRGYWVVLYFYPRDNTPGCTTEAGDFRDLHSDFRADHAVVLGVSADDLESHRQFARDHGLPFELLVDRDSKVAGRYGVWREKISHGRKYLGIVRSTFLIDPSGRIAKIFDNLRVKGHVGKVLSVLRSERRTRGRVRSEHRVRRSPHRHRTR